MKFQMQTGSKETFSPGHFECIQNLEATVLIVIHHHIPPDIMCLVLP